MKRTAISHLQKIPHMVRNVREYEQDEHMHGTCSYDNLRNYFIIREIENTKDQTTLCQEEKANSTVTGGKPEDL